MATYVLIVRHGQAQPADAVMEDSSRHLTEAGARALRVGFARTLGLLPETGRTHVLSSPYNRARETALILRQEIPYTSYEQVEGLATGDIPGVVELIDTYREGRSDADAAQGEGSAVAGDAAIPSPPQQPASILARRSTAPGVLVVLVGHAPMTSQLLERLTGEAVHMGKGAQALVRLDRDPDAQPEGKLLWFVQGPEAKRWQVLVDLEDILYEAFGKVEANLASFRRNPNDVEAVHQLRVSIRTIRSLVDFIKPWQTKRQNRLMQGSLRTIVRQFSMLRELDVLAEQVAEVYDTGADDAAPADGAVQASASASNEASDYTSDHMAAPEPTDSLTPPEQLDPSEMPEVPPLPRAPEGTLLREIQDRRDAECARVVALMDKKRVRRMFGQLSDEFASIEWKSRIDAEGLCPHRVRSRFDELVADYHAREAALDYRDVEGTHALRKQAKRVRYDAAALKAYLGKRSTQAVAEMKAVQAQLGDLCDARVNSHMLEELARNESNPEAFHELCVLIAQQDEAERQILADLDAAREQKAQAES